MSGGLERRIPDLTMQGAIVFVEVMGGMREGVVSSSEGFRAAAAVAYCL